MVDISRTLVERWFEDGDRGHVENFDNYLAPDVVIHAPLGFATTGIEAEKETWRRGLMGVPDIRHEVQEVVSAGSTVVVRFVVTGTHRGEFAGLEATGKTFTIDQVTFAHIRDEKIVEAWEVADTASLLKQLEA